MKRIYVSSDALWDLRQGVMTRISPEFAATVLGQPEYYTRTLDKFAIADQPPLDPSIYEQVFQKFKNEIVRCSLSTPVLEFLQQLVLEYLKPTVEQPVIESFGVEINLYPFTFSEQETKEIAARVSSLLLDEFPITTINCSNSQLSLEYIRENYLCMVMYDYYSWLNHYTEQISRQPLMTVGIYGPRVFFGDLSRLVPYVKTELKKLNLDEFEGTSILLRPFVGIQFLPVSFFCGYTPLNLPSYRQLYRQG